MSNKNFKIEKFVNDPFQGKEGFMPEKINEEIVVRLGLNENLAFPKEKLVTFLKDIIEKIDPRIYPEDYCDSLCNIIAEELNINPSQVVVGNGGDKIIDLVVRLTIKTGFNGVIINPTYPMFEHAIKVQGGGTTELLLTPAPKFDLNLDYILNAITPIKDRLLFLCSPNNPTGNQFDKEKIKRLINEFPGIIALDETYSDFGKNSMVSELNNYPNLIIIKSMSKLFGIAGMRVGYAIGNEFLIKRIKELLPAFNVNIVSLELAKHIMKEKVILKEVVDEITYGREFVYQELLKISKIIPYKSYTNFILFRIIEDNAQEIQKRLLKEKGVLVRNMSTLPLCENSLRVTITTMDNNKIFVKALKDIIETEE